MTSVKSIAGLMRGIAELINADNSGISDDAALKILGLFDSLGAGYRHDAQDERIAEVVRNYIKRRVLGGCRVCGCTDDRACPGGCHWVEPDLCSRCAGPKQGG